MQYCFCPPNVSDKLTPKLLSQWKSLPNLLGSQDYATLDMQQKRGVFKTRNDTLVPCNERSKSMDFAFHNCDVPSALFDEENALDFHSAYDLYLSKDFTDLMNASLSERSDIDSSEARNELDDSFDCSYWSELQTSDLTQTNLSKSLANQMYSYENLDRVGKNLYKINKWFQRCSIDNNDEEEQRD